MIKGKIDSLNRRQFLGNAAKTASALITFPTIISSKALAGIGGRAGVAPSDRIVFGTIGIGGQGTNDMQQIMQNSDAVFVAHCNVDRTLREATKKQIDDYYNSDIETYIDFRELLARPDIDAVLSTTGDRSHAMIAVYAMRAGKDVYSEKPGTLTIQEGQALLKTEQRYGRVYQGGAQRMCESNFIFANELVRLGKLGAIKTTYAGLVSDQSPYMRTDWAPAEPEPPKEEFWWDAWLGVCPWRPYNSSMAKGKWGWIGHHDFYNGKIGEWGSHTHSQILDAIEMTKTGPVEVQFPNNATSDGLRMRFKNGIELVLQQTMSMGSCSVRYEGSEGKVEVGDSGVNVTPVSLMKEYNKIVADYRERTGRRGNNKRDLLDCIKSRRLATTSAEVTHRAMSTVQIANICMWLKRDVKWDPDKEEFINDAAANRLRSRAQREPWAFV